MRGVRTAAESAYAEHVQSDAMRLLAESLHDRSHQYGIYALRAIGLLGDSDEMNLAIENLRTRDIRRQADVIEALESIGAKWRDVLNPLMKLWEDESAAGMPDWERLFEDDDAWIRECALFAAHKLGVKTMENLATLSLMDRILFFKRVPLFANLSPVDLKQVASIADEELFSDGEEIAHEGDVGDVMFIIVGGEVRVCTTRKHVIAGKAVAFREAADPSFRGYAAQIVTNAQALAASLGGHGFRLVSGGTDNHLMLVNLIGRPYTGAEADAALGEANITVNKNAVPNDPRSPFVTSGLRIGTPAVTTQGMKEAEMEEIGRLISRALQSVDNQTELAEVKKAVSKICERFPLYASRLAAYDKALAHV